MNDLLTGLPEIDIQIMLKLNMDTLSKLTSINKNLNKNIYQILNNPYFWKLKFEQYDLPVIVQKTSISDWINEFNKVKEITTKIDLILNIHVIEARRKHDPLNNIRVGVDNDTIMIVKSLFPNIRNHTDEEFATLMIKINNNDLYDLMISYIVIETGEEELLEIKNIDRPTVRDLMINIVYINEETEILDELSIDFILFYNVDLRNLDNDEKRIILKRFGIRDFLSM